MAIVRKAPPTITKTIAKESKPQCLDISIDNLSSYIFERIIISEPRNWIPKQVEQGQKILLPHLDLQLEETKKR